MTSPRTTLLASFALAVLTFMPTAANADTYHHIDKLAVEMQSQSLELIQEITRHYRHKTSYHHLRSDALQMYRVAAHMHSVAHRSGDVHHLRDDLEKADRLFHHMDKTLKNTDRSYGGHTHGSTHHVFELMHELEVNLHHLKKDIESLDDDAHHGVGPHRLRQSDSHHSRRSRSVGHGSYSWGSGGIRFSGRGWSLRFGH